MIQEAYMPITRDPDFHCGQTGPPEVEQEVLVIIENVQLISSNRHCSKNKSKRVVTGKPLSCWLA